MKEKFIECNKKEIADFLVKEFNCVIMSSRKIEGVEVFVLSNNINEYEKLDFSNKDFTKNDLNFTSRMMF
jgi:hypothetical protein